MKPLHALRPFYIVTALLVLAILVVEHVNGRFWLNDFRVYYSAADNLRHGLPVYGEVFGLDTGVYKYAPVVLYLMLPATWLSFHVAAVLHFLLSGLLLMACFTLMENLLQRHFGPLPKPGARALLGLLCIAVLLARELHMGNINLLLLFMALVAIQWSSSNAPSKAGLAWGVIWLVKPYLLLMAVPLVVRQEWRVLRTAVFTMLVGLALPLFVQGYGHGLELTLQWARSMAGHSAVLTSPDHFTGIWYGITGQVASPAFQLALIAVAGLLLGALTRYNRMRRPSNAAWPTNMELWLAMALAPNLVVTDQEHFLLAIPLVLMVLAYLSTHRDLPLLVAFVCAMILYGTRSTDLWGRALETRFSGYGFLGLGNFLLFMIAILAWWRWKPTARSSSKAG